MAVISRFCELYQDIANLDVDRLDGVYGHAVLFVDPVTTHTGIGALKAYFSRLLENAAQCRFDINNVVPCEQNDNNIHFVVTWTMQLTLKSGKFIALDGISELRIENDLIVYHRDYYDIGAMVYEHLPVLGKLIKYIKRKLA